MNFFNFNIKKAIFFLLLIIVPIFLVTISSSKVERNWIFQSFVLINGKIQILYHSIASSIYNTTDTYLNLINTRKQNRSLIAENKELKSLLKTMSEIKQENTRLNTLLNFQKPNFEFIAAQVISHDPISDYQLITINRGYAHNVRKKMIVINEKGVIGYVFRSFSHFSQVILLTDPQSAILAVVQRSRVHGIVEGAKKATCQLKYLKRRDDVNIGDIIVTSNLNPLSPGGFPIGKVKNIKKQQYGLTQEVTIIPFINPSELEEVLIVRKIIDKE